MCPTQGQLTQLSYFRVDPLEQRSPLPPAMIACSITMAGIGFALGWLAAGALVREARMHFWGFETVQCLMVAGWGVAFILVGIAIAKSCGWIRPVVLAAVPVFIATNIDQALLDVLLGQRHLGLSGSLLVPVAALGPMLLSGIVFVYFCLPSAAVPLRNRDFPSIRYNQTPLPLLAWSLGCGLYGLICLTTVVFSQVSNISLPNQIEFPWIFLVMLVAGALAFFRAWSGWLTGVGSVAMLALFKLENYFIEKNSLALASHAALAWPPPPSIFYRFLTADMVVSLAIYLGAAAFGIYAGRYLRPTTRSAVLSQT